MAESNVAVLIDYENVGLDSIQYLLDQISDVGRVIIKRAYADWSVQRGKRDQLLELGIEAVHHFRSNKSGKNSSDICLAIDAVDLLYGAPVGAFVIVSSDSDFVPLVSKLRAAGKEVIGAGRRGVTSPMLVRSCDRYIYLDDSRVSPQKASQPRSRETQVDSLVTRAVEASMDDQGEVVGSKLHQTMLRIDPSFNFKALGHRTFTQFLASCDGVKVTRPPDASDVIVQLNHGREQPQSRDRREYRGRDRRPRRTNGPSPSAPTPPPEPQPEKQTAEGWEKAIDAAWSKRPGSKLSGRAAAGDAAKVLEVPKLSASRYPSLDKLLEASEFLRSRWRREGNTILQDGRDGASSSS